jgi:hypothetical protein
MIGINKQSRSTSDRLCVAVAVLVLVIWLMAMSQLRSDSLPKPTCGPLQDVGFDAIPSLHHLTWPTTTYWATIADVWCFVTYIVFGCLIVPFCCKTPWLAKTRFTFCLAFVFALRTLTLLCTRYPQIPGGTNDVYITPNTALGAVLVVLGVRTTQTDLLFSGHTAGWILMAHFFWHYHKPGFAPLAVLFWLSNITGIILLIGVRTHYTADVLVGGIIAGLTFTCYHLAVDPAETWLHSAINWIDAAK